MVVVLVVGCVQLECHFKTDWAVDVELLEGRRSGLGVGRTGRTDEKQLRWWFDWVAIRVSLQGWAAYKTWAQAQEQHIDAGIT